MGNVSTKKDLQDQQKTSVDNIFFRISGNKDYITRDDLQRVWSVQIDKDLYSDIETYLFSVDRTKLNNQVFHQFYNDICKESKEKKVKVLLNLLRSNDKIPREKLFQFVTYVLNSILLIVQSKAPKRFQSWDSRLSASKKKESLLELGTFFLNKLPSPEQDHFSEEDLTSLLTHLDYFLIMVLSRLYDMEEKHFYSNVLPKWEYMYSKDKTLDEFSVLNLFRIMFLNMHLPCDFQNKWRFLFSSEIHGESFSRLTSEIVNKGPTIIIVEDKKNHIFGGFAAKNWALGPAFFGDCRSFLFTLAPKMCIYQPTNYNENFQYMNVGQQTMPNGLGMGGRLEYFAMWLNAEFGSGYCSESCTTFRNYKQMSASKEFEIKNLEVWSVGPPPTPTDETGERSILNSNLDAKAILELSGKVAYSDGLREEDGD